MLGQGKVATGQGWVYEGDGAARDRSDAQRRLDEDDGGQDAALTRALAIPWPGPSRLPREPSDGDLGPTWGWLWSECADRQKGLLRINRVDDDGQVHVTVVPGSRPDVTAFSACYKEKAPATLAAAERAASPARIVETGTRATSIAIETVNNRFLIPVVLNGTRRATFLLDTGANITVVSPQLARRAGVESTPAAPARQSPGPGWPADRRLTCPWSV